LVQVGLALTLPPAFSLALVVLIHFLDHHHLELLEHLMQQLL
jgi:hypothetical protein